MPEYMCKTSAFLHVVQVRCEAHVKVSNQRFMSSCVRIGFMSSGLLTFE